MRRDPTSPPLDPSGSEGHAQLRRELLHPEYHRQNLLQQAVHWLDRRLQRGLDAAHAAPPLSTVAAMVVFVGLIVALGLLVSRARRTATGVTDVHAVLTQETVTAAELHDRARTALAEGRYADAVVEGFRALTLTQVERGRLAEAPGATAREVSAALGVELPAYADRVAWAADRFDAVRYGHRPADRDQAGTVLDLVDELAGTRRRVAR